MGVTATANDGIGIGIDAGTPGDVELCVALWSAAVEARDGHPAVAGTEERCRTKFGRPHVVFAVARHGTALTGFGLVTAPGSGAVDDPPDAAYLAMLAVAPSAQGTGLGLRLLDALTAGAVAAGHDSLVLHVLKGNRAAVRLYESRGWGAHGEAHEHPLTGEAAQTYLLKRSVRRGQCCAVRRRDAVTVNFALRAICRVGPTVRSSAER